MLLDMTDLRMCNSIFLCNSIMMLKNNIKKDGKSNKI